LAVTAYVLGVANPHLAMMQMMTIEESSFDIPIEVITEDQLLRAREANDQSLADSLEFCMFDKKSASSPKKTPNHPQPAPTMTKKQHVHSKSAQNSTEEDAEARRFWRVRQATCHRLCMKGFIVRERPTAAGFMTVFKKSEQASIEVSQNSIATLGLKGYVFYRIKPT
jgi:hypothetical protein